MKRRSVLVLALLVIGVAGALAQSGEQFRVKLLTGFEEPPSVSTNGRGTFTAQIGHSDTEIDYKLTYAKLEGSVLQAHIHFGQRGVNGGISAFLCTNLGNGPAGTPACPPSPATVNGTITSTDIVGPGSQGIAPGEFAELLRAIRHGVAYVNVHSSLHTGGEVRGQITVEK